MTYRIRVTRHAELQIFDAELWWLENREKAPLLFEEELAAAYNRIARAPSIVGMEVPNPHEKGVFRILMPKTKTHVYYTIDEEARSFTVVAVWGAAKEHGPDLGPNTPV